ncbi:MAG: amidohydrolase [Betaproteobacteria bacterium]|nr:amidohydrolase [Betaproteobacteria bacterium]
MSKHLSPAKIHSGLKHPVVDADGHWLEYTPVFAERMRKVHGNKAADGFIAAMESTNTTLKLTPRERELRRIAMPGFWNRQAENTLDRATAMMPKMLYQRLDEIGTDFAIVYPTAGLRLPRIKDDETRRAVIRAYNIVTAEYFRGLEDRLTPAAIIPMHTPEEACEELEFVTRQLGSKVGMFGSNIARSVTQAKSGPGVESVWYDVFGIDSPYDYDAVWQTCVDVKMAPTFHSSGNNFGLRNSPSNFVYNHIGHFAAAGHATAKGIFLGGVTRRFPQLNFAFLEGGVGWGCQLFGDLIEHWERKSSRALERMNPDKLDRKLLMKLVEKHGYDDIADALKSRDGWPDPEGMRLTGHREELDDYAPCKITRKQDWVDLYAKPFYFGCEADDRMNATAFGKGNPFGAKLNAIYSSDIGHFDVIDYRDPLPEAYELVEEGHITKADFRDFVFANAVRLWGKQNPGFFDGTVVAKQAAAVIAAMQEDAKPAKKPAHAGSAKVTKGKRMPPPRGRKPSATHVSM